MYRLIALGVGVTVLSLARPGAAQSCNQPDLLETLPPDAAEDVPTDAVLSARYDINAEYLGEDVLFSREGEEPMALSGTFDSAEQILSITPPDGLEPDATYTVQWPELRGIASASKGRGREIEFTAGSGPDVERPTFTGIASLDWDIRHEFDECTDRVEERHVFDLGLGTASDDGGRSSLLLLVFQTAGPNVDPMQPEPVLVRALPADPHGEVRVTRTVEDTTGRVCFSGIVRDLTGKVSTSSAEKCVETVEPPWFTECSARPSSSGGGARGALATAAFALVIGLRRRRAEGRRSIP